METIHAEHVQKADRLASELSAHKADVKALKAENTVLKDSTLVGEKQREIEEMKAEHDETLLLLREMGQKLEGAVSDRDQLAERLADDDKLIEQRTADKVVAEREKLRTLETKMASLSARTADDAAKYRELEVEKNYLSNEVDDLTNWKAVYESGHGLQELARHQRSLKGIDALLYHPLPPSLSSSSSLYFLHHSFSLFSATHFLRYLYSLHPTSSYVIHTSPSHPFYDLYP